MNTVPKIYVFFGHGWTIDRTFSIADKERVKIVMLKDPVCLLESLQNRHKQQYMKTFKSDDEEFKSSYMKYLYDKGEEMHNKFCIYDNEEYKEVPDLLLTTHTKNLELAQLQEIGQIRAVPLNSQVYLLSELVDHLGDNFFLEVYACRSKLDPFQMENLYVFKDEGNIQRKVEEQELHLYDNNDNDYESPPCNDYSL